MMSTALSRFSPARLSPGPELFSGRSRYAQLAASGFFRCSSLETLLPARHCLHEVSPAAFSVRIAATMPPCFITPDFTDIENDEKRLYASSVFAAYQLFAGAQVSVLRRGYRSFQHHNMLGHAAFAPLRRGIGKSAQKEASNAE